MDLIDSYLHVNEYCLLMLNKAFFAESFQPGDCSPIGIAELRTQCLNPDDLLLSDESQDFQLCYCFVHLGAQIIAWPAHKR